MNKQIVAIPTNIVMPAVSAEEAVKAFEAYQDLSKKIMRPEDIQIIQGKEFKKKSFWRKCQRFFNLSLELREEKRTENKNGVFTYKFIYRAKAPNKTFVDGTGACSSNEKGLLKTEHNARAIAETRAKNRAIADLVAFGEVSAEEVNPTPAEEMIAEETQVKSEEPATDNQRKLIFTLLKQKGHTKEELEKKYGEIEKLDKRTASEIIDNLLKLETIDNKEESTDDVTENLGEEK